MEEPTTRFRAARRDPALAVLEGFHAVKHAVRFGAEILTAASHDPLKVVEMADDLAPDVTDAIRSVVEEVSAEAFAGLAPRPHPTGLIAIARRPPPADPLAAPGRVVVLEHPRRPNNVGAAIRVAAASSAGGVLVLAGVDPWNPEALRTAAGLHFALTVGSADELPATERPVVAFSPGGERLEHRGLEADAVTVFGTERSGLSASTLDRADRVVELPMQRGVSSLNLATAVAAALYRGGP